MNLQPWIDRIVARVPQIVDIEGAAQLQTALENGPIRSPSAFVIPVSEAARPNTLDHGGHSQQVVIRFSVILAVRNVASAPGADAVEELQTVRNRLWCALAGWSPDTREHDPAQYAGGRTAAYTDRTIWWVDDFTTTYYMRIIDGD